LPGKKINKKERITISIKVILKVAILVKREIFQIISHKNRRENNLMSETQSVYVFSGLIKNTSTIKPEKKIARKIK